MVPTSDRIWESCAWECGPTHLGILWLIRQVKELGVVIHNCSRLAQDLEKTFQTYWALGTARPELPKHWPHNFSTHINRLRPLRGRFGGLLTTAYFSVSWGGLQEALGATGGGRWQGLGPRDRYSGTRTQGGPRGEGLRGQDPGLSQILGSWEMFSATDREAQFSQCSTLFKAGRLMRAVTPGRVPFVVSSMDSVPPASHWSPREACWREGSGQPSRGEWVRLELPVMRVVT